MDFSQFDPYDSWAWRRLKLVIQHLETKHLQQTRDIDFRYYTAMAGSTKLSDASATLCIEQAANTRKLLTQAHKPWLPPEIDAATAKESIADKHRRLFGSPGEPRYEAMVAELKAAAKRTPAARAAIEVQQAAAAKRAKLLKDG